MGYERYRRIDFENGRLNGHAKEKVNGFESVHGKSGIWEQNLEGAIVLEFCDRRFCVW